MVGLVHVKIMDCRTCARWTNALSHLCSRTNGLSVLYTKDYRVVGLVHAGIMDCRTCVCWTNALSDLCPPE